MGNSNTDTCCLTLPLKLEKWQEDRLAKRFELVRQIYNTLVRAELKKLERVKHSAPYREIQGQIQALDRNNPNEKRCTAAARSGTGCTAGTLWLSGTHI